MSGSEEELRIICFDCGLNFTVTTDNPEVVKIFVEAGCLSPRCKAVHALLVHDGDGPTAEAVKTENGDSTDEV